MKPRHALGLVVLLGLQSCHSDPGLEPLRLLPLQPQAVFSGPTAGFHINDTASVTVVVISADPARDFRFAVPRTDEVLPHLCADIDTCYVGPSHLFPSLTAGSSFDLGTFVGPTQVGLGVIVCRPDQFTQSCPPTGNVALLFSSVETGVYRFGVEAVGAIDFNDLVFEFHATPKPTPDMLKVTVTVRRDSIEPVMAPCFDAVAQTAYNVIPRALHLPNQDPCDPMGQRGMHVSRTDTAKLTIHAFFAPSGRPAAGGSVTLTATPGDSGGGHIHDIGARPKGTFFLDGEDISRDGEDVARIGQVALTLSATGDAQPVYRTSGVSGSEVLGVRVQAEGRVAVVTDTLVVAVPGLVELMQGGNVDTVGTTTAHPDSHWGTQAMVANLRALGDSLSSEYSTSLHVNDMSLRLGGLFDVSGAWRPPHLEHRDGTSADVRIRDLSSEQMDFMREKWYQINNLPASHSLASERYLLYPESNHYHLRTRGAP